MNITGQLIAEATNSMFSGKGNQKDKLRAKLHHYFTMSIFDDLLLENKLCDINYFGGLSYDRNTTI